MQKEEIYNKILMALTSSDEQRPHLQMPSREDGFYYSTNAKIIVRIPDNYELGHSKVEKFPNVKSIFDQVPILVTPKEYSFSTINQKAKELTPQINKGHDCYACDGSGKQKCDLDHYHECPQCYGSGWKETSQTEKMNDPKAIYDIFGVYLTYINLFSVLVIADRLNEDTIIKLGGSERNRNIYLKIGEVEIIVAPTMLHDDLDEKLLVKIPD